MSTTQQTASSASTSTFVTALWLNGAVFAIELVAFVVLRPRFRRVYEPRTIQGLPPASRFGFGFGSGSGTDGKNAMTSEAPPPPPGRGIVGFVRTLFTAPHDAIKAANGLDAYFFVRFLRFMVILLLPIWIISWAVLLPITSVGEHVSGRTGLDRFTFGNIARTRKDQTRYAAHVVLAWVFTFWAAYLLKRELRLFLTARQHYLLSPGYASSAQASTMLVTGVPAQYLSATALSTLFRRVDGGVRRVWVVRDMRTLPNLQARRDAAHAKLEAAETKLLRIAAKTHTKQMKAEEKAYNKEQKTDRKDAKHEAKSAQRDAGVLKKGTHGTGTIAPSSSVAHESRDVEALSPTEAAALVPRNKRPTHRLPLGPLPFALPLIGKKVDTIEWAREELRAANEELEAGRRELAAERLEEEGDADGGRGERMGGKGVLGVVGSHLPGHGHKKTPSSSGRRRSTSVDGDAGNYSPTGRDALKSNDATNTTPRARATSTASNDRRARRSVDSSVDERYVTRTSVDREKPLSATNGAVGDAGTSPVSATPSIASTAPHPFNSKHTYAPLPAAFLRFRTPLGAALASQALTHHLPYRMTAKYTSIAPQDVLWSNLGLNPYEVSIRRLISIALTFLLIIFWALPVAFVGALSNITALAQKYHWLSWLAPLPGTVKGLIQGVLPPVLLAVLMMLLPIVLRMMIKFEGVPSRKEVELNLCTRFFIFQIIHSFLIVTLASGIIAALPGLVSNPSSIPSLLATNLPQASNFFLTYVLLQGLSGTAAGFLQVVPLLLYYLKLRVLGGTPRKLYNLTHTLRSVQWGTLVPVTSLIAVITLTYSVISPIINGLACFTFFLFYILWKYVFLYQVQQPPSADTGGLFFPKAIQHVFVGLYLQQICLAALFFLARDENNKASAIGEGVAMILLIIATAIFHHVMNSSYYPLLRDLPVSLADKAHTASLAGAGGMRAGGATPPTGRMSDETAVAMGASPSRDSRKRKPVPGTGRVGVSHADYAYPTDSKAPVQSQAGYNTDTGTYQDSNAPTESEAQEFAHPASVAPVRPVWIPSDALGLAPGEIADCRASGVEASSAGAIMDSGGKVRLSAGDDDDDGAEGGKEVEGQEGWANVRPPGWKGDRWDVL